MSVYAFKLPDVGEGMAEGTIGKWYVHEGDSIEKDADLVQIENDKSVEDLTSPVTGKVKQIIVHEGDTASVGDSLIEIETESTVPKDAKPVTSSTMSEPTKAKEDKLVGNSEVSDVKLQVNPSKRVPQDHSLPVLAMPSVRAYAREKRVDLTQIKGTGNHGQIIKADVDLFLSSQSENSKKIVPQQDLRETSSIAGAKQNGFGGMHREKMSSVRLATAKLVSQSVQEIPHVTLFDEVVVDQLWNHRNKFKAMAADKGVHLTFMPYIVKALAIVAKEFPIFNASLDMDQHEIIYKDDINIGIATDTDRGLFMPNIKNADQISMFEIAKQIKDHTQKIADGSLDPTVTQNGTIAITNIGSIGGGYFTPIIYRPEVAILGIGKITSQPIVDPTDPENIKIGKVLKLSLSVDHRAIDGATAQKALNRLKELLNNPELLLMEG